MLVFFKLLNVFQIELYRLLMKIKVNNMIGCFYLTGFSNLGDWWTAVDSEPSLSGASRLHNGSAIYRGPEFAHTVDELDGPYITINKGILGCCLRHLEMQ